MQELIARQKEIIDNIHKIHSNFNKDSASRKTDSYIKKRISSLDSLWAEFDINHTQLLQSGDDYSGQEYFKKDVFKDTQRLYERINGLIQNFNPSVEEELNPPTQARPALSDLMSEQKTNFRALQRLINSIDITKIVEKWELEDELKRLQSRWRDIDNLHLKIDNISQGEDETYVQIYCWTDSLVVLGWLQGNPARWKAFVANRTKEILDIVPSSCWRHVSSSDNAADCATRGLTISQLLQHTLWWEGPAWIKDDIPSEVMKLDLPQMEVKRNVHTHTAQRSDSIIEDILNKHSSITYVVRVIARVLRFITNVHHRVVTHSSSSSMKHNTLGIAYDAPDRAPYLTAIDIEKAYEVIIKAVQATEFQAEIVRLRQGSTLTSKSNLLPLDPYLDNKNILRAKWHHSKENLKIDDVVLIREDNMPPTKWALGRVKEVHPGLDGHVRVATLKTKSGETKRPIIKLIPLPVHTKKDNPDTSTEDERDDYPLSNKRRPTAKVNFVMATMLLLLTFLAPTIEAVTTIKSIDNHNTLYFDTLSNIRIVQDHWKMIVYYNMTTYWHNMKAVETYIYTKTETKYLAINVKKDTVIPMTENDIQACIPHTDQQLLCPLSHPIFTMQVGESLCNMQLFTSNENKPYCRPEIKQCSDRWIKLHTRNTWLYSCCTVCSIRIICPNEIVTKTLHHNGLVHLEKGCVIKGEAFLIYAEHDYTNEIYMEPDDTRDLPNSSTLNELISVPLPDKFVAENHNKTFAEIQQKIEAAKKSELPMFTHDHVHYTVIYTILFIVTTLVLTILGWYARVRWYKRKSNESKPGSITSKDETSSLEVRVEPKRKDDSKQTKRTNLGRRTQSNVDIATSPGLPRAIKFNLSASTSNLSN